MVLLGVCIMTVLKDDQAERGWKFVGCVCLWNGMCLKNV